MAIKVLCVDDHKLVLEGLQLMLRDCTDIQVIGHAQDGQEAIDMVEAGSVDVILMDLNMPRINGLKATQLIKAKHPAIKVLILSMLSEQQMIKSVINAGADGYLLKNSGQNEIIAAIHKVSQGEEHFDNEILEIITSSADESVANSKSKSQHASLSRREKEILGLIVEEYTTKEIAAKLFISFGTVESHRRNMISKLGVRNTAGLVSAAYKYSIL